MRCWTSATHPANGAPRWDFSEALKFEDGKYRAMNMGYCRYVVLLLLIFGIVGAVRLPLVAADTKLKTAQLLEAGHPVRIVCFGDSITGVYYHTGGRRAWCELLEVALARIYPRARIEMINAGISGNNTAAALRRMETDVLSHNPQLVVVMFCMNDVAGLTPEAFQANLATIVKRSRDRGAEVVLMTPNSIYPDDPRRPPARVAQYVEIVRQAGRELAVPVADCFRAYEDIRDIDRRAWVQMMSDTLHPNMRGHKLFAEEVAWTLTRRRVSLEHLPLLEPGLPRTISRLQRQQPVKVVAMKPYDSLIASALQRIVPGIQLQVTAWDAEQKSLAAIEERAKEIGWWRFRNGSEAEAPDLVVVAVPAGAMAPSEEQFYRSYTWILNWSLAFGKPGWDCVAVLPSVATPELAPAQRIAENRALEVIQGQDIPWLRRGPGDATPAAELLTRWLESLLAKGKP
jgi:acyl-CoA thioesterase I